MICTKRYQTIKILFPRMTFFLKLSVATALLLTTTTIQAYSASKIHKLQVKLSPSPGDILKVLDRYDKFWIEVKQPHATSGLKGSCVWSECTTGYINTDDDMMGDGCDGDENWYQYRHNHSVQMLHIHCMDVKRVMLVH